MNNACPMTNDQGLGNINSQFDDILLIQIMCGEILRQRCQQLHADQDIPPDILFMLVDLVILIGNDIGIPDKALHEPDLAHDFLYVFSQISLCVLLPEAAHMELLQFHRIIGDPDHFQCCPLLITAGTPLNLIYLTKSAFSDFPDDLPSRPEVKTHFRHSKSPAGISVLSNAIFCFSTSPVPRR